MALSRPALGYGVGAAAFTLQLAEMLSRCSQGWLCRLQEEEVLALGLDAVGRSHWAEGQLPAEGCLGVALAPLLYYSRRDCHPGIAVDLP